MGTNPSISPVSLQEEEIKTQKEVPGAHTQRADAEKRQEEGGHLQAKERSFRRNLTC